MRSMAVKIVKKLKKTLAKSAKAHIIECGFIVLFF